MPRFLPRFTIALSLAWSFPALAQGDQPARITVVVRDQASGQPVPNATVQVAGLREAGRTNAEGVWRSGRIPVGNRIVEVTRLGYQDARMGVDFPAGAEIERTVTLTAQAVEVGGVSATAERRNPALEVRGFYARQTRGHGAFMTSDRIEELRPMRTVDLFHHIRGFQVKRDRRGAMYAVTGRGGASLSNDCFAPLVYLDGAVISGNANYFEFINPESIEAIEAYPGASSVPEEYRMLGAACGVILIWTRMGGT